jgi:hypothetical protein
MAHKEGHRNVTAWLPDEEADALEVIAKQNERSMAAEMRLAIRTHIASAAATLVTHPEVLRQEAGAS